MSAQMLADYQKLRVVGVMGYPLRGVVGGLEVREQRYT